MDSIDQERLIEPAYVRDLLVALFERIGALEERLNEREEAEYNKSMIVSAS